MIIVCAEFLIFLKDGEMEGGEVVNAVLYGCYGGVCHELLFFWCKDVRAGWVNILSIEKVRRRRTIHL